MAFPKSVNTPIALDSRSNLDLSCQHVTTSDFLQFQVSKIIEMVPKQSISIDHSCFTRLAPLPVPTFGRANIIHRAFWVPMRTVFPSFDDFITDTPHYFSTSNTTQIVSRVPIVTNDRLCEVFLTSDFSTTVTDSPDFTYVVYDTAAPAAAPDSGSDSGLLNQLSISQRKFTPLGRFAYKLLRSLGITLTWTNANTDAFSLLPLYSCIRVYYDFFYPSQYINDEDSSYMIALLTRDVDPTSFNIDVTGLQRIFKILYNVPYASDYFTSAWDNPTAPSDEHFSDVQITDLTIKGVGPNNNPDSSSPGTVSTETNGTPTIGGAISQYALNSLHALSDYMRRHQISGSRALDRFLSRFGVKLSSEALKRCTLIHEYAQDLQFSDVFSTADTDGASLGDYAGKGASYGEKSFEFTAPDKDYGYLVIISTISPVVQYYQGLHRSTQHISRLDFFTPEFDALGTQAIGVKELYCPTTPVQYDPTFQDRVFGFTPRYSEYKIPYSQLTGDLSLPSFKYPSESWTLFRDLEPLVVTDNPSTPQIDYGLEHGINFIMATDKGQYNRIFQNTDNTADHFNVIHQFVINSSFPGKPMFEDYHYQNPNAEKVNITVNGTTAE